MEFHRIAPYSALEVVEGWSTSGKEGWFYLDETSLVTPGEVRLHCWQDALCGVEVSSYCGSETSLEVYSASNQLILHKKSAGYDSFSLYISLIWGETQVFFKSNSLIGLCFLSISDLALSSRAANRGSLPRR